MTPQLIVITRLELINPKYSRTYICLTYEYMNVVIVSLVNPRFQSDHKLESKGLS